VVKYVEGVPEGDRRAAAVEVLRVMMNHTVPYCIMSGEMWRHSSGDCEHLCIPGWCDAVQPGRYLLTFRTNVSKGVPFYTSPVSEYSMMIEYDDRV
jgi:hypothetical protein